MKGLAPLPSVDGCLQHIDLNLKCKIKRKNSKQMIKQNEFEKKKTKEKSLRCRIKHIWKKPRRKKLHTQMIQIIQKK